LALQNFCTRVSIWLPLVEKKVRLLEAGGENDE
jgi:hypothetical protein